MPYAVMNDYEECEIYIQKIPDDVNPDEFKAHHSEIGKDKLHSIYPNKELAKVFAHKDAIKSLWSYNPDRNIL